MDDTAKKRFVVTLRYVVNTPVEDLGSSKAHGHDFEGTRAELLPVHLRVGPQGVNHTLRPSSFKTARNSANTTLHDRDFRLNSYSIGSYVELGPLFATKLRYSSSQRAPEINELYASSAHYSVMTQSAAWSCPLLPAW